MKQMEEVWSLGPGQSSALHLCVVWGLRFLLKLLQSIGTHGSTWAAATHVTWLCTKTDKLEGKSGRLYLNVQDPCPIQTELSSVKKEGLCLRTLFKSPAPKLIEHLLSHPQVVNFEQTEQSEQTGLSLLPWVTICCVWLQSVRGYSPWRITPLIKTAVRRCWALS